MKNYTYSFNNINELSTLLSNEIIDSTFMLVQLFCADTNPTIIKSFQTFFQNNFPLCVLIGTTTDGIIDGSNVYAKTKNVVSFTIFEKTTLLCGLIDNDNNDRGSYTIGKTLAENLLKENTKVIISFADGIHTNGEEYVNGLNSCSSEVIISGGLAADNGELVSTYVFDKFDIINNGAVGVSLSSDVLEATTGYSFDWMPIGKEMLVTKAIQNRVYEIDGISAVDIYAKYMGEELAASLPQVGIEFPLIFQKDNISVGRAVLFKHDDGSLTFAGNIDEGQKVRFGVGSIERILKSSDNNVRKLLQKMQHKSEAVFIYSCMARRRFMKEYIHDELSVLSHLGKVSGFFTYGEFYHSSENTQLLNETMTILSLSESKQNVSQVLENSSYLNHKYGVDTGHVLAHLANTVSDELAQLNNSLEERVKENSKFIYQQAYFDTLTGLPNRLSLINRLSKSIGKMIVLINIDDFTTINDFYGHKVGDNVLQQLGKTLTKRINLNASEVFKLPSDEFAVIVDISTMEGSIESRLQACISDIESEKFIVDDGYATYMSVTISAAMITKNNSGLVNANMTLKLAKKAGISYMLFRDDLELAQQYEKNIKMANIIKNALTNDNIVPYFQPLFDMKQKKVTKYEALARLITDDGKVLMPFEFLEISQKIKLYPQITEIMIEKSFSHFAGTGIDFSINLAFTDILNPLTTKLLFSKISEYKIASQLTIEILETQENANNEIVYDFIDKVYRCGAKVAIDDFGSGYANFEHMTKIHSDFMKIDGSLIKNIDSDTNARLVVETIIIFAQKLHKKIVAEFVCSQEIYEIVKELGVDYAQGYYIGKPEPELISP